MRLDRIKFDEEEKCLVCGYYICKCKKEKRKCRFCMSEDLRAMNNNGIMGLGYQEWNHVCKTCGKIQ